ncbi:MAG: hypothetical protein JWQ98_525 [Chlorobi bacterium]|nr:hypothetical protein [Chlorobiota bacterium]
MVGRFWLLLLLAGCLAAPSAGYAQRENYKWYFGNKGAIDFSGGAPVETPTSRMSTEEGCSSIADPATGDLLFYTDGVSVWNRAHNVMKNGLGMFGHFSSTQSALIVPLPGSTTIYYIFTAGVGPYEPAVGFGICYSVVDMSLDSGYGAVIMKNVLIGPQTCEKLTAIRFCGPYRNGYWVIAHGWQSNNFLAWPLESNGVGAPVISTTGLTPDGVPSGTIGYLKASPDGTRLAMATYSFSELQLFHFDRMTGVVTLDFGLGIGPGSYGVSFSPNNSKLYVSQGSLATSPFTKLYQFDLSAGGPGAVALSKKVIATGGAAGGMQIGPDRKLYIALRGIGMGIIDDPDVSAEVSHYHILQMNYGAPIYGIPNLIDARECRILPKAGFAVTDSDICQGECITIFDTTSPATAQRIWHFEGTDKSTSTAAIVRLCYQTPGTYSITLDASTSDGTDRAVKMITVHPPPQLSVSPDTTFCIGGTASLVADGAEHYRWQPDDHLSCATCPAITVAPLRTTTYTVIGTSAAGCADTARVTVWVDTLLTIEAGTDTVIMHGDSTEIWVSQGPYARYRWTPAAGLSCTDCQVPTARPDTTTTYYVVVTAPGACPAMDSVRVEVRRRNGIDAGPDIAVCRGDSARLHVTGGTSFVWTPATGLSCANCPDPVAAPDATTTYEVTTTNPDGSRSRDSITLTVLSPPNAHAGPGVTIDSGKATRLSASGGTIYQWKPARGLSCADCPDPIAAPDSTTTYLLLVTDSSGCWARDSITVTVRRPSVVVIDPPFILSAGRDTAICRGDSISLTATGAIAYRWTPDSALACPSCAATIAHPMATTAYIVRGTDSIGRVALDTVIVTVLPAGTFVAHIDRDHTIFPGSSKTIPVLLDAPADPMAISAFGFTIRYQPHILRLAPIRTDGTLLSRWAITTIQRDDTVGILRATAQAPPGEILTGAGTLIDLPFTAYLNRIDTSSIVFEIDLPDGPCTDQRISPGFMKLDSICGLNFRLIEATSSLYGIKPVTPNPFGPVGEIGFSLGLDGMTSVEIFNGGGERVALLAHGMMGPGRYGVKWDASAYPAGMYFCRIVSGDWSGIVKFIMIR